jgi:hypothetical protein
MATEQELRRSDSLDEELKRLVGYGARTMALEQEPI